MNPTIVFCTTCKGRTQHIEETLPKNLKDNQDYENCKFVILDYCDPGELQSYLQEHITSGRVVAYRYSSENEYFHISHAKNIAARCGILEGADIIVTLDADNFTGPGFAKFIANKFKEQVKHPGIFLCPDFPLIKRLPHGPLRPPRGYAGRFAIRAKDFIKAGGYDETFNTWHGEDIDMISRLGRMGYQMRHIDNHFLNAIPHSTEVRFKEYPHAKQFENANEFRVIDARTETVVNYGQFGLGTVHKNYDSRFPIELKALPTRIFGIGMHKTGTTSLHTAFQILGFDSFHWGTGEAPHIWNEMEFSGRSPTLEQWYALSDLPIPLLYKQLDKVYPGSKFILTLRNERDWLRSVARLWDYRYNPTRRLWDIYPFTNRIHTELYGQKHFSSQVFLERYRSHNREVLEYFKNRPEDLFVMGELNTGRWGGLCKFLDVPVPSIPYPVANPTPEIDKYPWLESGAQTFDPEEATVLLETDKVRQQNNSTEAASLNSSLIKRSISSARAWLWVFRDELTSTTPPPTNLLETQRHHHHHHHHRAVLVLTYCCIGFLIVIGVLIILLTKKGV